MPRLDRRHFVQLSGLAAASLATASFADDAPPKSPPSERVRMGCIGVAGRAAALVHGFAAMKEVEVVRLCDIDGRRLSGAVEAVTKRTGKKPQADGDFRRIIDDNSIDAVAFTACS